MGLRRTRSTAPRSVAATAAGTVSGTLPYMSPEALRGEAPDARSDVWALGAPLQEMATGRRPFGGDTGADVTSEILRDRPAPLPDGAPEWAVTGQETEARALLAQLEEVTREQYICAYDIAVAHEALSDSTEAMAWLYKAGGDRADCIPYLNVDPRLDSLRPDSRFQALVEEVDFGATR